MKTNNNNSLSFARRQMFALESKFFPFRKDLFSEGTGVQENKQEVLKKVFPVNMWKSTNYILAISDPIKLYYKYESCF